MKGFDAADIQVEIEKRFKGCFCGPKRANFVQNNQLIAYTTHAVGFDWNCASPVTLQWVVDQLLTTQKPEGAEIQDSILVKPSIYANEDLYLIWRKKPELTLGAKGNIQISCRFALTPSNAPLAEEVVA